MIHFTRLLFIDPVFLFYFLPAALALHALALRGRTGPAYPTAAKLVLFGTTLVFYGFREPWWLVPFFVCLALDYGWARWLAVTPKSALRRAILALSLAQNVGLLVLFRYGGKWLPLQDGQPLGYPLGISFYTFESMSFVFDVYRREAQPARRFLDYAVFLGMFPRFLAGPIARFKNISPQIDAYQGMRCEEGLALFVRGLFLKVGFADQFAVFTRYAFDRPTAPEFAAAWIGVFSYALQLYFDFAGYSLMAIGLGRCFGFRFPENFDRPYRAPTMRLFWTRWHITLGAWVRQYLYFPLATRARRSRLGIHAALIVSFFVIGVWHGATANYALMGLWFGGWISVEIATRWPERVPVAVSRALTFVGVLIGWALGNARDLAESGRILGAMFAPWRGPAFNPEALFAHPLALSLALAGTAYCFYFEGRAWRPRFPTALELSRVGLAATGLMLAYSARKIPFLYFQF